MPCTIRVTSLLNSGPGTPRAAIKRADQAPGRDTITFKRSLTGTIRLTRALPALSKNLVTSGRGPSVLTVARRDAPGTPAFRIFTVSRGANVKISGLTISGGCAVAGGEIDHLGRPSVVNARISGSSVTGSSPNGTYPAATPLGAGSPTPARCRSPIPP